MSSNEKEPLNSIKDNEEFILEDVVGKRDDAGPKQTTKTGSIKSDGPVNLLIR